jgi:uncharacterized membrane protein
MHRILENIKNFMNALKKLFLSGIFTVIPITATVFFIHFAYGLLTRILGPLRRLEPVFLQNIPGSEFILVLLLILLLGLIVKIFIARNVIHYFERAVTKIPLVRIVYSSAKIVVDFFKINDKSSANKKVVLITYPKKGQYHIAFLLESAADSYEKVITDKYKHHPGEKYYKVFMPNSPNPTSGYFFIMSEDDIIHTDITFEEAIKTLVSCGLTTPESLKNLPDKK